MEPGFEPSFVCLHAQSHSITGHWKLAIAKTPRRPVTSASPFTYPPRLPVFSFHDATHIVKIHHSEHMYPLEEWELHTLEFPIDGLDVSSCL